MIRLVVKDLRANVVVWLGALAVAIGCGYLGGWVASLEEMAGLYTGETAGALRTAGYMMLTFSLVAAFAVLMSASKLTVAAQRRSYALWQLANMAPQLVTLVVVVQLALVALLGAVFGALAAVASFAPLYPLVLGSKELLANAVPNTDLRSVPAVCLAVAAVFVAGGLRGAREAGRTQALDALREPDPQLVGITRSRILAFVVLAACVLGMGAGLSLGGPSDAMAWSLFAPVLVTAMLVPLAPLALPKLLGAWTSVVPRSRWTAWYLARRAALCDLGASTLIETPIMVGFGIVSGVFSVVGCLVEYLGRQGVADINTLDASTAFVMLSGPVLLCTIGAAVGMVMSSRKRLREAALFVALGARPATLLSACACEAFAHAANASLAGAIGVVLSNAIVAHALGLPLLSGLAFGEGLVVSLAGFALVFAASLVPTCAAIEDQAAAILSAQS